MSCWRTIIILQMFLLAVGQAEEPERFGDLNANGIADPFDVHLMIGHIQGRAMLPPAEARLADINQDASVDAIDLQILADAVVGKTQLPQASATPAATAELSATRADSVTISGISAANAIIRVTGGRELAETVAAPDGSFSVIVPLLHNQLNRLFVIAIDNGGIPSAPRPLQVIHDNEPPSLFIDVPLPDSELTNPSIAIIGRVGDTLSGFMGLEVMVDGHPANVIIGIGTNGSFERSVPLSADANTFEVIARDALGNEARETVTVNRVPLVGPRMMVLSGNLQQGQVHARLPAALEVQVTEPDGTPIGSKMVTFEVTRSDGLIYPGLGGEGGARMLQLRSDAHGIVRVWWRLGGDAGCGNNRIAVSSRDIAGTVLLCASGHPAAAANIVVASGNNQRAEANGPAADPLRAWVNDNCNGVAGIPVTFTVVEGNGKVNAADTTTVITGATGHAAVSLTLGVVGQTVVEANFAGNPGAPATFVGEAVVRNEALPTRFSGTVLNNANQPIEGARCILVVAGGEIDFVFSDGDGAFAFEDISTPGPADLYVDGTLATAVNGVPIPAGSYPSLHFTPIVVPNADNALSGPVLLPELDPANAVIFDNSQDVELRLAGVDGLVMHVEARSMTRVDGTIPNPDDPAVLSLNQVNFDKIPMPFPDGAAPPFAWTLQPGGSHFSPPIRITMPNMAGLAPGTITYFLSFNHDINEFEIVATGHITEDGSCAESDPGSGISTAGWGGNCPPYPPQGNADNCTLTCLDKGVLTGGRAWTSTPVVAPGEPMTFEATDVQDSGGRAERFCPRFDPQTGEALSTSDVITVRSVGIGYDWQIVDRHGQVVAAGAGSRASFASPTPGTFSCIFTANARRNCAPDSLQLAASATAAEGEMLIVDANGRSVSTYCGDTSPPTLNIPFRVDSSGEPASWINLQALVLGNGVSWNLETAPAGAAAFDTLDSATRYLANRPGRYVFVATGECMLSVTVDVTDPPLNLVADTNQDGRLDTMDDAVEDDANRMGILVVGAEGVSGGDLDSGNYGRLRLELPASAAVSTARVRIDYELDPALPGPGNSKYFRLWMKRNGSPFLLLPGDYPAADLFSPAVRELPLFAEAQQTSGRRGTMLSVSMAHDQTSEFGAPEALAMTVVMLKMEVEDVTGLGLAGTPVLSGATRIPSDERVDGIATDWLRGVNSGAQLLMRVSGAELLSDLALASQFGAVNAGQFQALANDGHDGHWIALSDADRLLLDAAGVPHSGTDILAAQIYRPPVEFDTRNPNSPAAERAVPIGVRLTLQSSTEHTLIPRPGDLHLVRPPVVLVHGINSSPEMWQGDSLANVDEDDLVFVEEVRPFFRPEVSLADLFSGGDIHIREGDGTKGIRPHAGYGFRLFFADHSAYHHGNGELALAAQEVDVTVASARQAFIDGVVFSGSRVAVQRVDLVGHSYGGLLGRWYSEQSASYETRQDVRKLITMGTPHRGAPITNIFVEALENPLIHDAEVLAPLDDLSLGGLLEWLHHGRFKLPRITWYETANPSMAVPALRAMTHGSVRIAELNATPFLDASAYAALVGTNAFSLLGFNLPAYQVLEPKILNDGRLPKCYFPWLSEFDGDAGQSDGIVPVWSQRLPATVGNSEFDVTHIGFAKSIDVRRRLRELLNSPDLARGAEHRTAFAAQVIPHRASRDRAYVGMGDGDKPNGGLAPDAIMLTTFDPAFANAEGEYTLDSTGGLVTAYCQGLVQVPADRSPVILRLEDDALVDNLVAQTELTFSNDATPGEYLPFAETFYFGRSQDADVIGPDGRCNNQTFGGATWHLGYELVGQRQAPSSKIEFPSYNLPAPVVGDCAIDERLIDLRGGFQFAPDKITGNQQAVVVQLLAEPSYANHLLRELIITSDLPDRLFVKGEPDPRMADVLLPYFGETRLRVSPDNTIDGNSNSVFQKLLQPSKLRYPYSASESIETCQPIRRRR